MALRDSAHNDAINQTDYLRSKYGGDITKLDRKNVASYIADLITICEEGIISQLDATFLISETLWSGVVRNDSELESIAMLATMLEVSNLPGEEYSHRHWEELVEKIHALVQEEGLA